MTTQIDTAPAQRSMGLGALGDGSLIFKRKFRWTMEINYCLSGSVKQVAQEFVKIGARPQLDIEETEINYLHGKMWIPGKATWQTMTVTYYDVAGKSSDVTEAQFLGLFSWIASVYDITDPSKLYMGSRLGDYEGNAFIFLYDGCGNALEGWQLSNVWPQSVNFGELDMSSSEECTVELTLRYSNVKYQSYCPTGTIDKCDCTPCSAVEVPEDGGSGNTVCSSLSVSSGVNTLTFIASTVTPSTGIILVVTIDFVDGSSIIFQPAILPNMGLPPNTLREELTGPGTSVLEVTAIATPINSEVASWTALVRNLSCPPGSPEGSIATYISTDFDD